MTELHSTFEFQAGEFPVLLSIPHNGSELPASVAAELTEVGRSSRDTDWFLDRLYQGTNLADCSRLIARYSRYVVDLNRPADDLSLYPGQTTTGLFPEVSFSGAPLYVTAGPNEAERARRLDCYWRPYHRQVTAELARLRERFSNVVLWEAHSIASVLPRLFPGRLPDFNLGTFHGASCAAELTEVLESVLQRHPEYSYVINGRFAGGYLTRHYGQPEKGIHAVQLELSQATYLNEASGEWEDVRAQQVQGVLRELWQALRGWLTNQQEIP